MIEALRSCQHCENPWEQDEILVWNCRQDMEAWPTSLLKCNNHSCILEKKYNNNDGDIIINIKKIQIQCFLYI